MFEEKLADTIKEHVEADGSMILAVNYGPDCILYSIAQEAGVSVNGFPCKTTMWVEKNRISVSAGYPEPFKIIFPDAE